MSTKLIHRTRIKFKKSIVGESHKNWNRNFRQNEDVTSLIIVELKLYFFCGLYQLENLSTLFSRKLSHALSFSVVIAVHCRRRC